ncbi:MAG TPA: YtxH domain-containing protein [Terriglobales bacterium]|nr:YtxH domain-containing protein [Terriglobales bacterium]
MSDYQKYGEYSRETSQGMSIGTALAFVALGAATGAAVSLLLTPRSGPELRNAIREKADDAFRKLSEQGKNLRRRTIDAQSEKRVTSIERAQ